MNKQYAKAGVNIELGNQVKSKLIKTFGLFIQYV